MAAFSSTLLLLVSTMCAARAFVLPEPSQEEEARLELEVSRVRRDSSDVSGGDQLIALVDMMFDEADSNHDGALDQEEFWETFDAFDGDGDGRITQMEYVHFLEFNQRMGMFAGLEQVPQLARKAALMFSEADMDGDMYLSSHDAEILFNNLDIDPRDVQVTKDEYFERWKRVLEIIRRTSQAQGGVAP